MTAPPKPNPYAPPTAPEATPDDPANSGNIVLKIRALNPPVCVKCGATAGIVERTQFFSTRGAWATVFWLALLGPLLGALAALRAGSGHGRATLYVPLCPGCNARWRNGRLLVFASYLALVLALVAVRPRFGLEVMLVLAGLAVVAIYVAGRESERRSLVALHINETTAWLEGASPLAVKRMAELRAQMPKRPKRPPVAGVPADVPGEETDRVEPAGRARRVARRHPRV